MPTSRSSSRTDSTAGAGNGEVVATDGSSRRSPWIRGESVAPSSRASPPAALALVYLSGVAEIAVGIGLLIPRTRRRAAWATVALLVAIFPANVYMATHGVVIEGLPGGGDPSAAVRWGRLPLQGVLILLALWYTQPPTESDSR